MKVFAVIDNPFKQPIANQDDLKGLSANILADVAPEVSKNHPFPLFHLLSTAQSYAQERADKNDTNYSVVEVEVGISHLKNGKFLDGYQVNAHHFTFEASHGDFAKAKQDSDNEYDLSELLALGEPVEIAASPAATEVKASETSTPAQPVATEDKADKPKETVASQVKAAESAKPAAPVTTQPATTEDKADKPKETVASQVKAAESVKPAAPVTTQPATTEGKADKPKETVASQVKAAESAKPAAPVTTQPATTEGKADKPKETVASQVKAAESAKPAAPVTTQPAPTGDMPKATAAAKKEKAAKPVAPKPAAPKQPAEKKAPELNVDKKNEGNKKSSMLSNVLKFGALCLAGGALLTYGGVIAGATLATKLIAGSVITAGAMATSWFAYKGLSAAANAYSKYKANRAPANPENEDDAKEKQKAKSANDKVVEDALLPKPAIVGAAKGIQAEKDQAKPQAPANDPKVADKKRKGCVIL